MTHHFSKIENMDLEKLSGLLDCSKPLSEIAIFDLIEDKDKKPLERGNGVYIFHKDKKALYVGKASSRSFVERIPSHFDTRGDSWLNTFLKKLWKEKYKKNERSFESYLPEMVEFSKGINLTLINIDGHKDELLKEYCTYLEILLRLKFFPEFNPHSDKTAQKYEDKISDCSKLSDALKKLKNKGA